MSDDQLPTRAELASAYLDGELEAAERATVENDPDVMAMVDSFTRVRTELNTPQPVDDAARSAAVAAALAEFDSRHDTTSGGAVVTPLQSRRPRGYRVLTGVAAAVVIAVVGIAALKASNGNNENDSSAAVAPTDTAEPPQLRLPPPTVLQVEPPLPRVRRGGLRLPSSGHIAPEIGSKGTADVRLPSKRTAHHAGNTTAAATRSPTPAAVCVAEGETELRQIVYRGTVAVVVRADTTASGTLNATDCTVLGPLRDARPVGPGAGGR
jgi:hypothetical protein